MSNYDCGRCGTYVPIMNMGMRDVRGRILHITCPTPDPIPEPVIPTTPVRVLPRVRPFCQADQKYGPKHERCSGVTAHSSIERTYILCTCECHTAAPRPQTLDASEA